MSGKVTVTVIVDAFDMKTTHTKIEVDRDVSFDLAKSAVIEAKEAIQHELSISDRCPASGALAKGIKKGRE